MLITHPTCLSIKTLGSLRLLLSFYSVCRMLFPYSKALIRKSLIVFSLFKRIETLISLGPCRVPNTMVTGTRIEQEKLPTGEFVACWPIGVGRYNGGSAVFLAKKRRLLDPREEVLAVPISESSVPLLSEAMQPDDISVTVLLSASAVLFGRSESMYDNLPWQWSGDSMAKREAFRRSQGKGMMGFGLRKENETTKTFGSAYDLLVDVATTLCPARILSLVIEEEDSLSGGIALGGSAYLQRQSDPAQGVLGREKAVIEISTDEAVGVALSLGQQVHVDSEIWEGACFRPTFFMSGDGKMRVDLDVRGEKIFEEREVVPQQPPAWTIKSRGALSRMSVEEKRRCLRSSGVKPPRKRSLSGVDSKDNRLMEDLLLPLMDEAVRRDVLLARAWREGDFAKAGELCAGKSERHIVAEQLQEALRDRDEELAKILIDRLDLLETCRMDPTQDVGSYQKDLDADEWYLRNRRASMGKSE